MKKTILLCLLLVSIPNVFAQDYFPKNSGLKQENNNFTAFTNATIYITPTEIINGGTLLIQNGKVIASGNSVTIPENSIIINLEGKYIYPSFIDSYSGFGVTVPEKAQGGGRSPQYETKRDGFYWNDHVMPEKNAIDKFKYKSKKAKALREAGFGVVNAHIMDGIARGTGVLVALNDEGNNSERIINNNSGQFFSFKKSKGSRQSYPSSFMGSIALLKQIQHDAKWYAAGHSKTKDLSLEALIASRGLPSFIEAGDKEKDIHADKISDLFNLNYVIVGGGDEYENLENIKATQSKYIIPINFPEAFDVSDPYAVNYLTIEEMRNWNQAPSNPKTLADNGVVFALTTYKLKKPADFNTNLKKAIKYGFDKTKALEALTTIPAEMLGKSNEIGTLKNGSYANFLITSGELFNQETTLYENWVQGNKNVINPMNQKDIRGTYAVTISGKTFNIVLSGKLDKIKSEVTVDTLKYPSKFTYKDNWMTLSITDKETKEVYNSTAIIKKNTENISGKLLLPSGRETTFTAIKKEVSEEKKEGDKKENTSDKIEMVPLTYPNVGYGFTEIPKQQTILFKNATVWTNEAEGILTQTDVLVKKGKIAKIGTNLNSSEALVIDATGKHITSGIVDEHSHIALSSVNEGGQNSSAEVSVGDALNPEDMNLYYNLAGGVTTIQLLHGSANPIGGRSAIIKPRWGADANGLLYKDAPKFIKFALGENVKQSNWQSFSRFPQTRMGVEQMYINYFTRAQEYEALKKIGKPFRYDEEMEVLVEILNSERFISCHSYVQSEINMLMKVAERFGFRINTFTHILEGYKVADKMKEHGVGGSTFSDWWAYKYEVIDAIPYNATIMHNAGITVAINSDDAEMSRRLNQEAAKSVKYGGMSEEDAWKMVTLNPAKLLHLDTDIGSIKEGKVADLVLWSDHPLSIYAKAEKTLIEGAIYFDIEKDKQQRTAVKAERNKLINLMRNEKSNGGKKKKPTRKERKVYTCETM